MTVCEDTLQAACQTLLSPVAPKRAPEWERLWITHLYPLKASGAGEEEEEGEPLAGSGQMGFSPGM